MEKQLGAVDVSSEFDGDPRWQLVQRILASPQFARSARLKSFLQYVTRSALLHRAEQVTEQQIGVQVFGRPEAYSAGEDNIVRSQARFLRAKLAEYFDSEAGQEEPMLLTIPKGSYLPHFEARMEMAASQATVSESRAEIPVGPLKPPSRLKRIWIPAVAIFAFLLTLALVRQHLFSVAPNRGPESALWSRLFDGNRQTTLVASDYVFSMVQEAAGRTLSLDEYLAADYFNRVAKLNAVSGLDHLFPNLEQRHYTGFENVTSVARLLGAKEAQSTHTVVRFARDMTMRDVGAGNLILLGSKQSNPWDSLFESKLNFRFEYQGEAHKVYIVNRAPQPGEEAEYQATALDSLSRTIYGGLRSCPT